ncbi:hypothetical protein MASR1M12_27870 [Erysipelotrichia bacterium]
MFEVGCGRLWRKRREIRAKVGFCGDMAGYAGCGAESGIGRGWRGLVVDLRHVIEVETAPG